MLAEFWRGFVQRGFHPEDRAYIPPDKTIDWTLHQALKCRHVFDDDKPLHRKLHRNLFAHPYAGSLKSATVFILYGNPGFSIDDYQDEHSNSAFVKLCTQNLQGKSKSLMFLDPNVVDTGGGNYWRKRFRHLGKEISKENGIDLQNAYKLIGDGVAILEACAYHSKHSPGKWATELPSSIVIKEYVQHILVPRAEDGEILLLVWRSTEFWDVNSHSDNIMVRSTSQAQGSYLSQAEREAIKRRLLM